MSWANERSVAEVLGRRQAWHGPAGLYQATAGPDAVLASLFRRGEGWTVVVDPGGLPAELRPIAVIESNRPSPL
jgi:hypothetical protein